MNKGKHLIKIATLLVIINIFVITAFAYSSVQEVANKYGPGGTAGLSSWHAELAGYFNTSGGTYSIVVGNTIYYYDDEAAIINAANQIDSRNASTSAMQDLSQAIDATTGGGADFSSAAERLSGFREPFRVITGVVLIVAVISVVFFTALDIVYMSVPFLQEAGEEAIESGNRAFTKADRKSGDGGRRLRFISRDATKSLQQAEETDHSPVIIYAKRRLVMIIATSVVVWFVAAGKYMIIVEKVIALLDGILKLFN